MWKIKYEWLKPGVREREIEAKVHEFMLERGCEIIYDIIVASGGNTSPYRRWATDKLIRQGDLVIVDINAVGPSGYFIDFVRCFKCGGAQGMKMTPEGNRPLPRGVRLDVRRHRAAASPATPPPTWRRQFPHYDDDKYGDRDAAAVRAQHRHHAVRGHVDVARLLDEVSGRRSRRTCTSRSRRSPAIRASSRPRRLEENVLVTANGPVVFTRMEHMEEAMK